MIKRVHFVLRMVLFTTFIADSFSTEYDQSFSGQKTFFLDPGESYIFETNQDKKIPIKLISAEEKRDSVVHRVRSAVITVDIGGDVLKLKCAPYVMPMAHKGIRIQADSTRSWYSDIPRQIQFSVWNESDPIVDPDRFGFPFKEQYDLFSQGMQTFNEMVWRGWTDDGFGAKPLGYHNYGIDISGYEGRDTVYSSLSGVIVGAWPKTKGYDPGSVVIQGDHGLFWEYAHLDSVEENLKKGDHIQVGDRIGVTGKRGRSGRMPHLHLGSYTPEGVKKWKFNRRLNLYPWYVTAYQNQFRKNLYSVAGDHHILYEGETAILDGSNSICYDSKIKSFKWVFNDGSSRDGEIAEQKFDNPGVYSAGLWVENELGRRDVSFCEIRVFPEKAPKPLPRIYMLCTPNYKVRPGQKVFFKGILQNLEKALVEVDFGDGEKMKDYLPGTEITHEYQRPGIYVVTSNFKDQGLPFWNQVKVTVSNEEGPP